MGYTKKTWVNKPNTTTPIMADDLNHIEQGIYDATYENGLNVSNEVDEDYRVNLLEGNNLFKGSLFTGIINEGGDYSGVNTRITNANSTTMKTFILPAGTYTFDCEGLDYCAILTKNESGTRIDDFADSWKALPFTFTTTQDAYVYISARRSDNAVISPDNYWYNLQEGSTIEPIQYNEIVVDNEKYSDTLNVGTSVDSRSRVNVLHSKNLFDISKTLENATIGSNGTISTNSGTNIYYIPIEYGKNYIMSFIDNSTGGNVVWGFSNTIPYMGGSSTYNVNTCPQLNNKVFTAPSSSNKYLCIRLATGGGQLASMSNIQIEEGSTQTTYEPYITPSIVVDSEEIYSKDNLEQYSTNEIRIGTWIDGKPLYRKVVEITTPADANYYEANLNISNIDKIMLKDNSFIVVSTYLVPFNSSNANASYSIWASPITNGKIALTNAGASVRSRTAYICVEYTKTTD